MSPRGDFLSRVSDEDPGGLAVDTSNTLAVDITVTGAGYTTLCTISVTLAVASTLFISGTVGGQDAATGTNFVVIEVDGTVIGAASESSPSAGSQYMAIAVQAAASLAQGAHTIKLRANSTGTFFVQPFTEPTRQSAVLFVREAA